jgi:putative addiction module component (TIGR02574 family)
MEKRFTREKKMTQNDLLAAIEALPKELQFALATSVLDRLAAEGPMPVSEQLQTEFLQREQAFFADPSKGESWEVVREELFGK